MSQLTWVDWVWRRYTTHRINVQVFDGGSYPVDITGWNILWRAGAGILDKSTLAGSITITSPANGVFTYLITAADSLLFPYGGLAEATEHECKGEKPDGTVVLIFMGRMRYTGTLITSL